MRYRALLPEAADSDLLPDFKRHGDLDLNPSFAINCWGCAAAMDLLLSEISMVPRGEGFFGPLKRLD